VRVLDDDLARYLGRLLDEVPDEMQDAPEAPTLGLIEPFVRARRETLRTDKRSARTIKPHGPTNRALERDLARKTAARRAAPKSVRGGRLGMLARLAGRKSAGAAAAWLDVKPIEYAEEEIAHDFHKP
jgi:hypothetical protein